MTMDAAVFPWYLQQVEHERWGPWYRFDEGYLPQDICDVSGLYRIGVMDADRRLLWLTYIGQTGRGLRGRLGTLRRKIYGDEKPGTTPHVAAPPHWVFQRTLPAGHHFECSVFALPGMDHRDDREACESLAISWWRLRHGWYPLVNFGALAAIQTLHERVAFLQTTLATLPLINLEHNVPSETHWLDLPWSDWQPATVSLKQKQQRGIYRVRHLRATILTKVGFGLLQTGLSEYRPKRSDRLCDYEFSWFADERWHDYHYRALVNDLVSAHFIAHRGVSIDKIAA